MLPILPLNLTSPKPKHFKYPAYIQTVGEELRKERMDRNLSQHAVAEMMGVNKNMVHEIELGKYGTTIYALHKVYTFLGYVPTTLNIDITALRGKLFAYRIRYGLTYAKLAHKIGLDKSTLTRFELGRIAKEETIEKIEQYLKTVYDEEL